MCVCVCDARFCVLEAKAIRFHENLYMYPIFCQFVNKCALFVTWWCIRETDTKPKHIDTTVNQGPWDESVMRKCKRLPFVVINCECTFFLEFLHGINVYFDRNVQQKLYNDTRKDNNNNNNRQHTERIQRHRSKGAKIMNESKLSKNKDRLWIKCSTKLIYLRNNVFAMAIKNGQHSPK